MGKVYGIWEPQDIYINCKTCTYNFNSDLKMFLWFQQYRKLFHPIFNLFDFWMLILLVFLIYFYFFNFSWNGEKAMYFFIPTQVNNFCYCNYAIYFVVFCPNSRVNTDFILPWLIVLGLVCISLSMRVVCDFESIEG